MKTCTKCHKEKALTEFHRRGNGHQIWCKQCAIAARVDYYKRNRKREATRNQVWLRERIDRIKQHKLDSGCVRCGYKKCAAALCFHHRDGSTKELTISLARNRSFKHLWAEIAKCDILCANCHAEIHHPTDSGRS